MDVRIHLVERFRSRVVGLMAAAVVAMAAVSCGSEAPPPSEPAAPPASPPAAAPASTSAGPRVFFVEPQDGATVKSPVKFRFGIENYELAAVPQGTVTTVRPGMGHHHLGVDQDCLPAGTEIVRGTPAWVHFGDAKTEIDMQLTPGPHKFALQLGDDLHRTVDGLCTTVNITVAE
jgi:hypothetical protein